MKSPIYRSFSVLLIFLSDYYVKERKLNKMKLFIFKSKHVSRCESLLELQTRLYLLNKNWFFMFKKSSQ